MEAAGVKSSTINRKKGLKGISRGQSYLIPITPFSFSNYSESEYLNSGKCSFYL